MNKLKCKVCGCEFPITANEHYVARDNGKTGLVVAFQSTNEEKLYDAFDCMVCGCQVIAQERKRDYIPYDEFDEALEMAMAKEDFEDE